MIPEFPDISEITYERYPKQKIIIDSITGFFENIRNFFKIQELIRPKMTPINKELKPNAAKLPRMRTGVPASILLFDLTSVNFKTVLNKMMETASLMIPSPKTILNNLGYYA